MKYAKWELGEAAYAGSRARSLVEQVLEARGLTGEAAWEFLRTDEALLCDPFLLKDMDRAAERLRHALDRHQIIAIYGDYDVDGVTATCLLYRYLQSLGATVLWYIPCRLEEGYGLNPTGIHQLWEQGADLIVTVDCGITAVDEVEYARSLGMDVIITDHHSCKAPLPAARAVVNPQRPDCPYPFKGLAGVGVALKLAMALGADLYDWADLAALGTVADVMPLVEENRAIVAAGLELINHHARPGVAALLTAAGTAGKVTAVTLGYTLAPRLNAAGRLGVTQVAVELLLADGPAQAEPYAQELCRLNHRRQELEGDIFKLCEAQVERDYLSAPAIVLAGESWHQGVVGIVASRLAERFRRPAFVISLEKGMGKGSCRGMGGVSVLEALAACGELLEEFGGHAMAAGFTVRAEHIDALRERLCAWVDCHSGGDSAAALTIDCVLEDARLLDIPNVDALDRLEPHGAGNPRPTFLLPRCVLLGSSRVGAGGKHMRFRIRWGEARFSCIFFSCPPEWDFRAEDRLDLAFTPQVNRYNGEESVQLVITDVRGSPTRSQLEQGLYQKYRRRESLSAREALMMLPSREEFAGLWRCIHARAPLSMESSVNLARLAGRSMGQESYVKTMIGLEVFQERGLIELELCQERVSLRLCPREGKVDLEESPILMGLRALIDPWTASPDGTPSDDPKEG